jgi:TRAP-type C4-dicarboxylate transport system permease small subunit
MIGGILGVSVSESYIGLSLLFFGLGFLALSPKISRSLISRAKNSFRLDQWIAYGSASFATFMMLLFLLSKF